MGSGLARGAGRPWIACEKGSAGSVGSTGSAGKVRRKKNETPQNIEMNLKRVPPWRRGRPKAGIDCPEGAELCRMAKRTCGITGKRSDTDEVNPATMDCASSRHSILRLWRGPSPRACSAEKNHAVCKPNPQFLPTHFCFQT